MTGTCRTHVRQRGPPAAGAAAHAGGQLRAVPRVVRAAADRRPAGARPRRRSTGVLRPDGPGPVLHADARGVTTPSRRRPQLARQLLAVPLPRPPRPDRAQRQLLLPVHRQRRPRRADQVERAAGLVLARRSTTSGSSTPRRSRRRRRAGAPMSMEQNKFLFSATRIPGDGAGHRPHALHRRLARPVARAAHRGVLPRPRVPDGRARRRRRRRTPSTSSPTGCARSGRGRADTPRTRRGPPHHARPAPSGPPAGRRCSRRPGQRGRARRPSRPRCSACAWRTSRPATTAAACDQLLHGDSAQPVVRQGRVVRRLRRRHGRDQRRALRARRDDGPRAGRRHARHVRRGARRALGARSQGVPDAVARWRSRSPRSARTTSGRPARTSRGSRRPPRPGSVSFDDFGSDRAKELGVSPDALRADGLPARPPAGEGLRRRHLRVDRHPAVPPRPHRGDARRHARRCCAFVAAMDDPADRRRRPPDGVRGGRERPRPARQGVPGGPRARAAPVGAAS